MLFGVELFQLQLFALLDLRQLVLGLFVLFVLLVFALFVDRHEAVELDDRAGGAEQVTLARLDVNRRLVEYGRHHLRSNEALPDQLVERQLILAQEARHRVRRA